MDRDYEDYVLKENCSIYRDEMKKMILDNDNINKEQDRMILSLDKTVAKHDVYLNMMGKVTWLVATSIILQGLECLYRLFSSLP